LVVLRAWSVLFLVLILAGQCRAATITAKPLTVSGSTIDLIIIQDELEFGDEKKFADVAIGRADAVVLLASPGGNLNAGIEIGKAIRLKGFATAVPRGVSCASACAIAWLGGRIRLMGEGSTIGFHAAYREVGHAPVADSVANALVGAYLGQLGLPPSAIAYITEPNPNEIRWLTFADAARIGIEVERLGAEQEAVQPGNDAGPAALGHPSHNWSADGEWIQLYSRTTGLDAVNVARPMLQQFPNVAVFEYDNGWYVVALGPYPPGTAGAMRDGLRSLGRIPPDSLVNSGRRFIDRIWPTR
jgi:hypothetical protein